jgi:hypothetical protein
MNANTNSCSDCACHFVETCTAGYHPLVGNGFCDDDTNVAECDYDGGDCCGYSVTSEHCTECICFIQETCIAGVHPSIGNGFCNDETNIAGCNYDDGDCCVNVNKDSCSECNCLGGGVITSPGFPENYDSGLDLTWLIQVKLGQLIETNFLLFDVNIFCNDFLIIYDGASNASFIVGKYCGDSIPPSHISSSNKIMVHFETDGYEGNENGFELTYNPTSNYRIDSISTIGNYPVDYLMRRRSSNRIFFVTVAFFKSFRDMYNKFH